MAFDITKLLLTPDRQSQLTAALANATETAPLETICAEAEARVMEEIGDLTVTVLFLIRWFGQSRSGRRTRWPRGRSLRTSSFHTSRPLLFSSNSARVR